MKLYSSRVHQSVLLAIVPCLRTAPPHAAFPTAPIYEDGPIDPGRERKIIGEREIEQPIHDGSQCGTATELLCRSLYALRLDTMEPNNLPGGFETGETL